MILKHLKDFVTLCCFFTGAVLFAGLYLSPDIGFTPMVMVALAATAIARACSLTAWRLSLKKWNLQRRLAAFCLTIVAVGSCSAGVASTIEHGKMAGLPTSPPAIQLALAN